MDRIEKHPFQGIVLSSILQDRSIVGRREMRFRRSHGMIIKLRGTTEYCANGRTWTLHTGEILFVKKGSSYFIREIDPGYSFVVNFESAGDLALDIYKLPFPQGFDIVPPAEKMYRCWQKEDPYGALCALYGLLAKTTSQTTGSYSSPREKQLLEPVIAYLTEHLTDPELSLDRLPQLAGISDAYLRRIFKRQYGSAPAAYVIHKRIALAKQLLLEGEKRAVGTIAAMVGYKDPLYFSRLFKKQLGISPTEYCKSHMDDLF